MALSFEKLNADMVGAWASGLCAMHCAATPLLFAAQASAQAGQHLCGGAELPWYWLVIDWAFLLFAFFAIYYTSRQVAAAWVKWGMWAAWSAIALSIIMEAMHWHLWGHAPLYASAVVLIGLHLYNHRQCRSCRSENEY
ncbi:MAG: MerC domain-containing protein [Lewinellaceae bacterium]|nr:MerC domain-containing protein [Lewinellaceae bacterium]MCB9295713.1 MerC domain-containing protein [Lewinellaceae bacterium]